MRFVLSVWIFFSTFTVSAHEFFFAFAEVEYKKTSGVIETTLIVTTHDFEKWLHNNGWDGKDLNSSVDDSLSLLFFENEINNHFQISSDIHEKVKMQLIGYENLLIGTTQFYLRAEVEPIQLINFKFDLMMDMFPEQQNKLNFIHKEREIKTTLEFLPSRKEQGIDLY
jgi:hypothetical protein